MENKSGYKIMIINQDTFLLEWNEKPSEILLSKLLFLRKTLERKPEVLLCRMGYRSLLIQLNKKIKNLEYWNQYFNKILSKIEKHKKLQGKKWIIPVCYENNFAPDIIKLSKALKLDVNELIHLHSKNTYKVYFIGFLPGFPYLSGLDPRLHYQRKAKPKLNVPKGSVAIGGKQTGIYTTDSPGGWHIIGFTPISLFNPKTSPPYFIKPGDTICFQKIDSNSLKDIEIGLQRGDYNFFK